MLFVGLRVALQLLRRQRLACCIAATRIADHPGEIADQKDDLVTQLLELAHLVEQHGVAEVQIGRGGIETGFHAQPAAGAQPLFELFLEQDFDGAASDHGERVGERVFGWQHNGLRRRKTAEITGTRDSAQVARRTIVWSIPTRTEFRGPRIGRRRAGKPL